MHHGLQVKEADLHICELHAFRYVVAPPMQEAPSSVKFGAGWHIAQPSLHSHMAPSACFLRSNRACKAVSDARMQATWPDVSKIARASGP